MTLTTMLASLIITILPPGAMTLGGECGKDIGGMYNVETKEIIVCELGDGQTSFYKSHEVAHYIWYTILTNKQRLEYTKLYDRDLKKGILAFYDSYSMSSEEEDFADNYALLTMGGSTNKYVKARIKKIEYYLRITKGK